MIRAIPWTWGDGTVTTAAGRNAQWLEAMQAKGHRTLMPRIRGDQVLPGDIRDPDPALDTWEGEAT